MKFYIYLFTFLFLNYFYKVNCLEIVEIRYDNNNCNGKPELIKYCNKNSKNGKTEIIGMNNKTGNKMITQTFEENKKVYTNKENVCIPEGNISFYFILHETSHHQLSIPISENYEYCNEIQLLDYDINKRKKQCNHHALITSFINGTCLLNEDDKDQISFFKFICDPNNGDVKRFICNTNCKQSSCEFDTILMNPKLICPHLKEISLEKLIKKSD
ncbi:hypothetical protein ACTA71_012412 [Dictyostelium dimigraforme]